MGNSSIFKAMINMSERMEAKKQQDIKDQEQDEYIQQCVNDRKKYMRKELAKD